MAVKRITISVPDEIAEKANRSEQPDVIDALVVLLARSLGAVVITSDPDDLKRLDNTLVLHAV